uniref:SET domain-containing protein n=1 Tax=Micromonas commoda virus TaxID=3057169 RepID=A0AAU7YQV2_9PHYC
MILFVLTFVAIVVLYHTIKTQREKRNFHLLEIKESTRPGAGLGAFATRDIPAGLDLGRYYGVIVNEEPEDPTYAWRVESDHRDILGRPYHVERHVDAKPMTQNNPLRYVNSPVGKEENWLINTGHKQKGSARNGCMHYYTKRKIKKGEELFVDYGEVYRNWMENKLKS